MCCLHGCASGEYVPPVKKLQPADIREMEEKHGDKSSNRSNSNSSSKSSRSSVPANLGVYGYRSPSTASGSESGTGIGLRKSQQNNRRTQGIPNESERNSTRGTVVQHTQGHPPSHISGHTQGRTAIQQQQHG